MRICLIVLTLLLLVSCGPSSDQVVISEKDYKKLIGDTIKPEYPKNVEVTEETPYRSSGFKYYLGNDGHEYQEHVEQGVRNQWTHYGGCKKCQKERDELNRKLDLIIETIKTNKNNE